MSDDKEQITKTGILQKTIFYKQETSFVIGIFLDPETKKEFTAKGTIVSFQTGLTYKLTGKMEENGNYGEQLNFSSFETVLPRDENGIFKYITRICKWVGNKTGNELVDTFGPDTLTVMKNEPEKIALIKGITRERALEIQATLLDNEKTEAVMVELGTLLDIPGLRKNLPTDLITKFGSNAAEIVKKNPYILTSFHGTSFILADRVAIDIGTDPRSIERKKAATCHIIKERMSNGNVWVEERELIQETALLIGVMGCDEGVKSLFDEDILTKKHSCVTSGNKFCWYAFVDDAAKENNIAQKLAEIMSGESLLKTAIKVERSDFSGIDGDGIIKFYDEEDDFDNI